MSKEIGKEYWVVKSRTEKGKLISIPMVLEEIKEYQNQKIYIFADGMEKFASYNYEDKPDKRIDWNFLNEINQKFIGVGIFD